VCDRILLVDDDETVLRAYETHFGAAGFEVHRAANLQQAAERLSRQRFAAVIADVCLTPGMGAEGLTIAAFLRNQHHQSPVVVLTAYGAPAFLHKPVSLVWLEGLLRARIEDRRSSGSEAMAATG
jgi:DNA-binding NtrC family response regulator